MKTTKLILMAFAVAGMLASCSKAADNGIELNDNTLKSVTLTITNPSVDTKAVLTNGGTSGAPITMDKLKVFFVNGSGVQVADTPVQSLENGKTVYEFHDLPATVEGAVVTNITNTTGAKGRAFDFAALNVPDAEIPVWGTGAFGDVIAEDNHDGVYTKVYACTVPVVAEVAKVEILGIAPVQFAAGTKFAEFTPAFVGIHNLADTVIANYYYPDAIMVGEEGEEVLETPEQAALRGLDLWETAKSAWNVDAYQAAEEGQTIVYSYVVPAGAAAPDIILEGTGTAPTGGMALANPYYVRSKGFKDFTGNLVAGNVYQVDFTTYAHDNIEPWYQGDLKCVDVTVSITNWNLVAVTANFE